jgi:5-(hydroxymethyl)furfural/furfural oxidase
LGIPVIRDVRAVGRNLQNHPAFLLAVHLRRETAPYAEAEPALLQNILRFSSRLEGCPEHDMLMYPFSRSAWHPLGRRVSALIVYVNRVFSRGSVELLSADCHEAPRVRFNLLSDARDCDRLVNGVRFALELLDDPDVRRLRNEVFVPDSRLASHLARRAGWKSPVAWLIAAGLDCAPLRRAALRKRALDVAALSADQKGMRQLVRAYANAAYHVCGTCRMGAMDDPEAVTDSCGRVRGVFGLRVGDASIFPTVPRANTHLTVLMAAEKVADQIKSEWRRQTS